MSEEYILEMINIHKSFPGVKALEGVSLRVKKGTIHALMGENGAGKSTLMKILNGIYQADEGIIKFKGKNMKITSTHDAIKAGISMIHQELSPIPHMTISENIFLGREPSIGKTGFVKQKEMDENTMKLLKELDINLNPKTKMRDLSIANTQMVEIAKAISYDAELIIMDEPTSAISDKEIEHLFKIMLSLKNKGVSIIYISHKLDEIFKIADVVTVLRDGKYIGTEPIETVTKDELVKMMVGRELTKMFPKEEAKIEDVILEVRNLTKKRKFKDINIKIRKGEILGISGLMGAGRTEVVESIFGIDPPDEGEIYINGEKVNINSPMDAVKNKMALITEDRKLSGLFLPLSVEDNMISACVDRFKKGLFIDHKEVHNVCEEKKELLRIKTPNLGQIVKFLSGGNQQKVLIARWLLTFPDILILDEPTRGIDVGAKAEIHRLMSKLAQEGKAIIMISSELPEILGMSDRIIVMHEGRITGEFLREEASQDKIMMYATGLA